MPCSPDTSPTSSASPTPASWCWPASFDDAGGDWRGLFVFAVDSVDQARALVASDPVIRQGEMVAEYHRWYGSAAAMMLPEIHRTLTPPAPTGGAEPR